VCATPLMCLIISVYFPISMAGFGVDGTRSKRKRLANEVSGCAIVQVEDRCRSSWICLWCLKVLGGGVNNPYVCARTDGKLYIHSNSVESLRVV